MHVSRYARSTSIILIGRGEQLLFDENFKPVLKDGEPVFVPITTEEEKALRDRYDLS